MNDEFSFYSILRRVDFGKGLKRAQYWVRVNDIQLNL